MPRTAIRTLSAAMLLAAFALLAGCGDLPSHKIRPWQPDQNPAHQMHN